MRVLVADDSRDAADSLALVVERWGHEVRVAYGGPSAIQVARHFCPDVALLDVQMPKVNGAEVAIELRRQAGHRGIMIIATSATDPDDTRLAPYHRVFDCYLSKPCDLKLLHELLAEHSSLSAR